MFYTHFSVKQVGLASNNSLRKRSINGCQEDDDEAHSSKVRIDSRGKGARKASVGHIRLDCLMTNPTAGEGDIAANPTSIHPPPVQSALDDNESENVAVYDYSTRPMIKVPL